MPISLYARQLAGSVLLALVVPQQGAAQSTVPTYIPPVFPLPGTPTPAERALLRRHPEVGRELVLLLDITRPMVIAFDTSLRDPVDAPLVRWTVAERRAVLTRAARAGAVIQAQLVRPIHLQDRRANATVTLDAPFAGAGVLVLRPGKRPQFVPAHLARRCDAACWQALVGPQPSRPRRTA